MEPLVHPDPHLAPALASWLADIGAVEKGLAFPAAAEHCVSLCKVVVMFAPHLLSDNDFFVPNKVAGTNAVRQRRYNTRRLARSLAQWFGIDSAASPTDEPGPQVTPSSTVQLPPAAKERVKCITDAATADHDPETLLLLLGEVLLCAAVNSQKKNLFVESILNLSNDHQEALADSIRRTTAEDLDEHSSNVLMEVSHDSENTPPDHDLVMSSQGTKNAPAAIYQKQALASQQDILVAPRDIPLADFKALAEERDVLRRRCSVAETEKDAAVEAATKLRRDLQDAGDRIRVVLSSLAEKEAELEQRNVSLLEARSAVRESSLSAEEVDVLRAQAASSEKFETSLKRASKRLEEAGEMRETIVKLEAQNIALRDSETRATAQLHFVEGQLKTSTESAETMSKISDDISLELEAKKDEIREIMAKNSELEVKLESANVQLATMLVQSEGGPSPGKVKTSECDSVDRKTPEFDQELVSTKLFEELGVSMSWSDVVDCVRGVVEAMNEMDAHQLGEGDANSDAKMGTYRRNSSVVSAGDPNTFSGSSYSSEGRVSMDGNTEPDVHVLPNFADVDAKREVNKTSEDDLFDYAVDHANVAEVPLLSRRPSQLSTVPEDREGFEDDDIPETYEPGPASEPVADTRDITGNMDQFQFEQEVGGSHDIEMEADPAPTSATDLDFAPADARRMSVSIRPTGETSQQVVRQTRSEILSLQKTLNALHADQASSTLHALVTQLDEAREEANHMRAQIQTKETECDTLRHDLDSLIKEHDATIREVGTRRETADSMLGEKERVIKLLEEAIATRDAELKTLRAAAAKAEATIATLQSEATARAAASKESTAAARANEVEIARLKARLEAAELIAGKLGKAMDKTDGLTGEIHRARESYFQDLAESARREKEEANDARNEAQRAAEENAQALSELKQAQRASARPPSVCCSDATRKVRRTNRIGNFWRRMLHRDAGSFDNTEARGAHTHAGGVPAPMRMRPASVGPAAAVSRDFPRV